MITRLDVYLLTFIFSLCIPTQSANLNIDFIGDTPIEELLKNKQIFKLEYDKYEIDNKIDLRSIKDTEVFIFFGIWCHDSQREVPRMLRILHELDIPPNQISLIGLTLMILFLSRFISYHLLNLFLWNHLKHNL